MLVRTDDATPSWNSTSPSCAPRDSTATAPCVPYSWRRTTSTSRGTFSKSSDRDRARRRAPAVAFRQSRFRGCACERTAAAARRNTTFKVSASCSSPTSEDAKILTEQNKRDYFVIVIILIKRLRCVEYICTRLYIRVIAVSRSYMCFKLHAALLVTRNSYRYCNVTSRTAWKWFPI